MRAIAAISVASIVFVISVILLLDFAGIRSLTDETVTVLSMTDSGLMLVLGGLSAHDWWKKSKEKRDVKKN